jgi:hypothetical protein
MSKSNPRGKKGYFARCVEGIKRSGSAYDPAAVCAAQEHKQGLMNPPKRGRHNPAQESVEAYRDFHGKDPDELVTVQEDIHFHRHLAGAGELRRLKIRAVDGSVVVLSQFKGAILAFNEDRNQLFIRGGDQEVDVTQFGIRHLHEVETLGEVLSIDYHTSKKHLGSEGGTATYRHKFAHDASDVRVKILRYPDLIYYVRDQRLVFSGGDYEILAEGIDK